MNFFKSYSRVYKDRKISNELELVAAKAIKSQEQIGIDIVNDGELQRSGYFSVFYESLEGFLPTSIRVPYFLNNGTFGNHTNDTAYKILANIK